MKSVSSLSRLITGWRRRPSSRYHRTPGAPVDRTEGGAIPCRSNRIAVAGSSAGGYLRSCRDSASLPSRRWSHSWGYRDMRPWYSRPDPFYSKQPAVASDEAYGAVGGAAISQPRRKTTVAVCLYRRQHGLWPKEVASMIDTDRAGSIVTVRFATSPRISADLGARTATPTSARTVENDG
jgi:hypothetical protein